MATSLLIAIRVPFACPDGGALLSANSVKGSFQRLNVVCTAKKVEGNARHDDAKASRIHLKRPKRDLTAAMASSEEQAGIVLNACLNAVGTMDLEAMDACLEMADEIREAASKESLKK